MKNFKSLQRALATRNFCPELVALPRGDRTARPSPASTHSAPPPGIGNTPFTTGNPPTPQTQGHSRNQEAEKNPHPAPQMQIGPGFRIRIAIDETAANGVDIPLTDVLSATMHVAHTFEVV